MAPFTSTGFFLPQSFICPPSQTHRERRIGIDFGTHPTANSLAVMDLTQVFFFCWRFLFVLCDSGVACCKFLFKDFFEFILINTKQSNFKIKKSYYLIKLIIFVLIDNLSKYVKPVTRTDKVLNDLHRDKSSLTPKRSKRALKDEQKARTNILTRPLKVVRLNVYVVLNCQENF